MSQDLITVHWDTPATSTTNCTTCGDPQETWPLLDPLHLDGSAQCANCRRWDIDDDQARTRAEDQ